MKTNVRQAVVEGTPEQLDRLADLAEYRADALVREVRQAPPGTLPVTMKLAIEEDADWYRRGAGSLRQARTRGDL